MYSIELDSIVLLLAVFNESSALCLYTSFGHCITSLFFRVSHNECYVFKTTCQVKNWLTCFLFYSFASVSSIVILFIYLIWL